MTNRTYNKVFGVGLSKTGTTSLSAALRLLGLSSIHYPSSLSIISEYDSATDLPVALAYKDLDALYPDSLFILTTRDINDWLGSMERHINKLTVPQAGTRAYDLRVAAYGSAEFNTNNAKKGFINHNRNVFNYFKERAGSLLIMDQSRDFNWQYLCDFLSLNIPENIPFPIENIKSKDSLNIQKNKT